VDDAVCCETVSGIHHAKNPYDLKMIAIQSSKEGVIEFKNTLLLGEPVTVEGMISSQK